MGDNNNSNTSITLPFSTYSSLAGVIETMHYHSVLFKQKLFLHLNCDQSLLLPLKQQRQQHHALQLQQHRSHRGR